MARTLRRAAMRAVPDGRPAGAVRVKRIDPYRSSWRKIDGVYYGVEPEYVGEYRLEARAPEWRRLHRSMKREWARGRREL